MTFSGNIGNAAKRPARSVSPSTGPSDADDAGRLGAAKRQRTTRSGAAPSQPRPTGNVDNPRTALGAGPGPRSASPRRISASPVHESSTGAARSDATVHHPDIEAFAITFEAFQARVLADLPPAVSGWLAAPGSEAQDSLNVRAVLRAIGEALAEGELKNGHAVVLQHGSEVAALMTMSLSAAPGEDPDKQYCWLDNVVVAPRKTGQSHGVRALEVAADFSDAHGHEGELRLSPLPGSSNFFERAGAVPIGDGHYLLTPTPPVWSRTDDGFKLTRPLPPVPECKSGSEEESASGDSAPGSMPR